MNLYDFDSEIDERVPNCSNIHGTCSSPIPIHSSPTRISHPSKAPSRSNRLDLPQIPLQENAIYRQHTKHKQQLDYHGLKEMERKVMHAENKYFSINDIYNSKLINRRSRKTRDNKIEEFLLWLEDRRARKLYAPTIQQFTQMSISLSNRNSLYLHAIFSYFS